jgi:formylglycine-generating enzyme required for sulfatase activity
MKPSPTLSIVLAAGVLCEISAAQAPGEPPVAIEIVVVGNPGNPGEQSRLPSGDPTFYGGVAYTYAIGVYEVTAGQYTAFLNAVAATDAYGLYHTRMDYDADPTREGCNIKRQGASGSYTYSVAPEWANRPVNYVSWADAARFANWLHNGQPPGAQDLTTTEDGSYFLNGIRENNDEQLEDVVREPDATWVIPSEDEWYKAAYHRNDGVTGNYWNYPTNADNGVSNTLVDPDPGNHATFSVNQVLTIGAPYYRTGAGAHENSASPYGTFDQGGNVMEFTEAVPHSDIRRIRGGSWFWGGSLLFSSDVDDVMHSSDQFNDLGFRMVMLDIDPVSVPSDGDRAGLLFRVAGPHPFRNEARALIVLPEAARVHIEVFDIAGRRVPGGIDKALPPGASEVRWKIDGLPSGIYLARLSTIGRSEVVRFVRLR